MFGTNNTFIAKFHTGLSNVVILPLDSVVFLQALIVSKSGLAYKLCCLSEFSWLMHSRAA